MIQRATNLMNPAFVETLKKVGDNKLYDANFIDEQAFQLHLTPFAQTLPRFCTEGKDWVMLKGAAMWLFHGPKVATPSEDLCVAMEKVEVRLRLPELAMPFPEVCVLLPKRYAPYEFVMVSYENNLMCVWSKSADHLDDIVTLVKERVDPNWTVDDSLSKFDDTILKDEANLAHHVARVAVNVCLMLTGKFSMADPHLAASDARLAKEKTERGERARNRNVEHLRIVEFDRTIVYKREERRVQKEPGDPTGREMPPHWRRGHWRMQACGTERKERKRILIAPCRVRWDLYSGPDSDTSQEYLL